MASGARNGRQTPVDPEALQIALGYRFGDPGLLETALTHRSRSGNHNNERLEFLGDAFLGYVVGAELYRRHGAAREDELTLIRASLVRERTLAEVARGLSLGDFLLLGQSELRSGGFRRASLLADALEAVIGAVLLDGGEAPARDMVLRLLGDRLDAARPGIVKKDPKTRLQEFLQARGDPLPEYEVLAVHGNAPEQTFVVACRVAAHEIATEGRGSSRRGGEQQAARDALADLEARQQPDASS